MTQVTPQNSEPNEPELKDLLDLFQKEIFLNLNSHHIAKIQSFDPINQTASATINYSQTYFIPDPITKVYGPSFVNYPVLIECPVIVLGGGPYALTFPIAPGDDCLVLFNDRDLNTWFQGSTTSPPPTPRAHSFSDGIILVGLNSLNDSIDNYDMNRAVLRNGETMIGIGPSLIKIANASFTLNGLLQNLSTQLEGLTTKLQTLATNISTLTVTGVTSGVAASGPPANAASFITSASDIATIQTNITNIATELGELLE